jgi:hypothetical protein
MRGVGLLAAGDELAELDDLTQVAHVGRVAAHGLQAVLERRVEPAEAELPLGRVVGQGRDAEDVEPWQLVDEMGDVGDVRGRRPALDAGDRVDHVRRRRSRDHDGAVVRDRAVVLRVAAAEGEAGRRHLPVPLDDGGRKAHEARLVVHRTPVLLEDLARGGVVSEDAHRLEDLERGLVGTPDLDL